jgi:DNA topoisomerase I
MRLMIVESPTKAKKIASLLGDDWVVKASMGHIADLPDHELAIAPETYELHYVPSARGQDVINALLPLVKQAEEIYLASDPDREGEAISAHLKSNLNITSYKRVTFNEITEAAVHAAIDAPRQIDANLVSAQEARRALDRLIGFRVSPPLSSNAGMNLSAGRCQSPAVRLVVDRQAEIDNFKVTDHFSALVEFDDGGWTAEWNTKPFLGPDAPYVLDQSLAERAAACRAFTVTASSEKTQTASPPAPFTTSALLQAAGASLGFAPALTQALAQKLFEGGHITYHRTDSPNLSDDGIAAIQKFATEQGWPVCERPRHWPSPEGAQEAHEAIRPTHVETQKAGEGEQQEALYSLVWRRAVACQLADAEYRVITAELVSEAGGERFEFQARSSALTEKGWKIACEDNDKSTDEDEEETASGTLPLLDQGSAATAANGRLLRQATKPPVRYSETSLIRKLEHMGIGRPSTFASIVSHVCEREYVTVQKRFLYPAPAGIAIVQGLGGHFSFMDYDYTKDLEKRLDLIAEGKDDYLKVVSDLDSILDSELGGLANEAPRFPCPTCGKALHLINGKKGPFWGCSAFKDGCKFICQDDGGKPGAAIEHTDTPSEKALAYAHSLAEENKLALEPETLASAKLLGDWIDAAVKGAPPRMASDKQKQLIKSLIEKNNLELPKEGVDGLTLAKASAFLDAHLSKSKKDGDRFRSRPR